MKIFNFISSRFGVGFLSFLLCAAVANAAIPVIDSPLTASATVGEPFSYVITTAADDATLYGISNNLPDGVVRSGATLSGVPLVSGVFPIRLDATNADGTGTEMLTLTVSNPVPVITSGTFATGRVGQAFSYTITATNSPDDFGVIGLTAFPGLSFDSTSGLISGTPTATANTDIQVSAINAAGTASQIVTVVIQGAQTAPSTPTVVITSPSIGGTFEGTVAQIAVSAEVTPIPGETLDVVFARWNNPTDPAGNPLTDIVLTEMIAGATNSGTGAVTYTGTIEVGFNPNDRQIGGGLIDIDVVAFQTNAAFATDAGSDNVTFTIKPVLEFLFPEEAFAMDSIAIGDVFASARLSTNNFASITARIAGSSIVDTVIDSDASDNLNGVFNFLAGRIINSPGFYDIRITALDGSGNTTIVERRILISDSLAEPVAILTSPTPGFTNEVFSAAILSFAQTGREVVTVQAVGVVGFNVTYRLTLISGGQGYFPRNASDVTILATDSSGLTLGVPGATVANGRVSSLPDDFTVFYRDDGTIVDPEWNTSGNAILDDLSDPGRNGWISIAGQFFKANAELSSYKLYVNGEDVTPGSGNLDRFIGLIDVPVTFFPGSGRGSPAPGDYIVYAQVTDRQGEVGTSEPLTFSIVPFEPLEITLFREGSGDLQQGDSLAFFADVSPIINVESVEFFDSDSGDSLGFASSAEIDGEPLFRFTQDFNAQGNFGLFAVATGFNGQVVVSSPIRVQVTPVNDLAVVITDPTSDRDIFKGESLTFVADADATPGVASVAWVIDNVVEETDTAEPFEFARVFDTVGSYRVLARGTDNFGNIVDSSEIIVTVTESDLVVSLSEPIGDQTLVQDESLTFTADASATLGVDRVEWSVDGEIVETDTASPYTLTFSFTSVGTRSVFARAYDSLENTASSGSITVQVNSPNSLLRDEDFVADTYNRLLGRGPRDDERVEALAALDGTLETRALFLANLLQSDRLQSSTIASLIYRTMTGDWPDSSELAAALATLTNGGAGVVDANALTVSLVPEYESRFALLNTQLGFVSQLFKNKHSGVSPTPQSEVRLFNSATGAGSAFGTNSVPGYSGDLTTYATQFALDNDLSQFAGVDGLPLTSIHYYSIPNRPADDSLIVILISALLGVEPTQVEINALSSLSLTDAVTSVLTDSRYFGQFPSTSPDGFVAQKMAALGVFDISLVGADDDADGDGDSNIAEILLNADPSDPSDQINSSLATMIDGTDFVVEFVRLKPSLTPTGVSVAVECSDLSFPAVWMPVSDLESQLSLSTDQSGISSDYERVEFRIDMTAADCNFVRLSIE